MAAEIWKPQIEDDDKGGEFFEKTFTNLSGSSIADKHEFKSWYFSSHRGGGNLKSGVM
jgi:hypothetical protein